MSRRGAAKQTKCGWIDENVPEQTLKRKRGRGSAGPGNGGYDLRTEIDLGAQLYKPDGAMGDKEGNSQASQTGTKYNRLPK